MVLKYENIIDSVSESPEQASLDKECSDLMIRIHQMLDLRSAPIKNTVQALGVTPSQARNLAKGKIDKFSFFELQTFLKRLTPVTK
jgi:predicted XRE-type DNA-binding protein